MTNPNGRFGVHGGQYIPETLMNAVIELEEAYNYYKKDPAFNRELTELFNEYAGRPSRLYYAKRMTKDLGGAKIYLKREDLNHTGAHKINNTIGQALLARRMGKTRLIAETMGRFPEQGAPDPARQAAISHVLRVSLGYALLCGVGAGVMLFPAAPYIGRVWLGDLRTIPSLRVLALSLPVVSLSGCLSGYFTGMRRVALPSLTGVVSQVLRLSLCAALLGAWLPRGASYACLALVVGSVSRRARRTCSAACFTSRCRSRSPPACGRDC